MMLLYCILVWGLSLGMLSTPHQTEGGEAKGIVRGKITNMETGEPLENVNVFLARTTLGTSSGSEGHYEIKKIPPGIYDLVFSMVGYELRTASLRIPGADTISLDLALRPRVLQAEEIQVYGEEPSEWRESLRQFVKAFLGRTENAKHCTILNPEILNFWTDPETGFLEASAGSALHIENRALGFRVDVLLSTFAWDTVKDYGATTFYPRFDTLKTRNGGEHSRWLENRERTYRGSLRHFLSALFSGSLEKERFEVRLVIEGAGLSAPLDSVSLVRDPGGPFKSWSFAGWLHVGYKDPLARRESYIRLNEAYAFIDSSGHLFNPLSIGIIGDWANDRVADMIPIR